MHEKMKAEMIQMEERLSQRLENAMHKEAQQYAAKAIPGATSSSLGPRVNLDGAGPFSRRDGVADRGVLTPRAPQCSARKLGPRHDGQAKGGSAGLVGH